MNGILLLWILGFLLLIMNSGVFSNNLSNTRNPWYKFYKDPENYILFFIVPMVLVYIIYLIIKGV